MCCLRDRMSHGRGHLSVSVQETCEPVARLAHGGSIRWRDVAGERGGWQGGRGRFAKQKRNKGFVPHPPHLLPHASTIDGWDWLGLAGQRWAGPNMAWLL
jgi:hypothetical protein